MKKLVIYCLSIMMVLSSVVSIFQSVDVKAQEDTLEIAIVQLVSHPSLDAIVLGVQEGLEEAGYQKEKLSITVYNAEGDLNLLPTIADTVAHQKPNLIFAVTTPVAQALAQVTEDIPIILTGITDPVGAGLVEDLQQPTKNITGVSDAVSFDEQFELVKQLTPEVNTIGMLYTTSEDNSLSEITRAQKTAESQGFKVIIQGIDSTNDMPLVAETLINQVDALFVASDNTIASAFETLLDVADRMMVPIYSTVDMFVEQGAIAAVAIRQQDIGKQAAVMAKEVLDGKLPSELPIQFVQDKLKVVNYDTLERLNITLPESLENTVIDIFEVE